MYNLKALSKVSFDVKLRLKEVNGMCTLQTLVWFHDQIHFFQDTFVAKGET